MCNLFSQSRSRDEVARWFRVPHNRAADIRPQASIFPGGTASVVRHASDGERELVALSWGFVLHLKDQAPKRVTNARDDKLGSTFWRSSFQSRRCLVPVTSFCEPKGKKPAVWHWFALDEARTPFAFAGMWRPYRGPLKKDGDPVELDVFSFVTTNPNELVATVHPQRMPVMLVGEEAQAKWLEGSVEEANGLIQSYPADSMMIVQRGTERQDPLAA